MNGQSINLNRILLIIASVLILSQILLSDSAYAVYCTYGCTEKLQLAQQASDDFDDAVENAWQALCAWQDCYQNPNCNEYYAQCAIASAACGTAAAAVKTASPQGLVTAIGALSIAGGAFISRAEAYWNCRTDPYCAVSKQACDNAIVAARNARNVMDSAAAAFESARQNCPYYPHN